MNLYSNETLVPTDVKGLAVTNLRIRYDDGKRLDSMYLAQVSSIHYHHEHRPIFIIIGIILAAGGAFMMGVVAGPESLAILAIAVICFVGYFATRHTVFEVVGTGGGKIELSLAGFAAASSLVEIIEGVMEKNPDSGIK